MFPGDRPDQNLENPRLRKRQSDLGIRAIEIFCVRPIV